MRFNIEGLPIMVLVIGSTLFTWGVTALGAAAVFFFKNVRRSVLDSMLGFGSGVMIAASFWSLLSPAIEISRADGGSPWLMPALGFVFGGLFVIVADSFMQRFGIPISLNENGVGSARRSMLLITAITLHNIPEGMAIGVAFASVGAGASGNTLEAACILALGIGIQNFTEGASVSLPLRREGLSVRKSFFWGQLSGSVEPISAVVAALACTLIQGMLPFLLSFSAGAMIAVVSAELLPESASGNKNLSTFAVLFGFVLMMVLDIALV